MVFQDKNNLNFFNCDENESKSSDPNDDRRDYKPEKSKGIDNTLSGGTENIEFTRRDDGVHPDDGDSAEAVSSVEENAILKEKSIESKGDESFYHEFNYMFEVPNVTPDNQSTSNLRRSSRKTSMPKKLSDFKLANILNKNTCIIYMNYGDVMTRRT
nr:ribonuclease H-like domain-containing protein [Tanacetum cinerariifolium]